MMTVFGSNKYDHSGRKRKTKKPKGIVYEKYAPPPFTEHEPNKHESSARYIRNEATEYRSVSVDSTRSESSGKQESLKYTGDYIIGVATMHKSNAVPVTNAKYAREISEMSN